MSALGERSRARVGRRPGAAPGRSRRRRAAANGWARSGRSRAPAAASWRLRQQVAQQLQRQVVGPVQVVEHEQTGAAVAGGLQQGGGGLERAQSLDVRLGGQPARRRRRAGGARARAAAAMRSLRARRAPRAARRPGRRRRRRQAPARTAGRAADRPSSQRPYSTRPRRADERGAASSAASRVLPMPGSPLTKTPRRLPADRVGPRVASPVELRLTAQRTGMLAVERRATAGNGHRDGSPRGPADGPRTHPAREIAQLQLAGVLDALPPCPGPASRRTASATRMPPAGAAAHRRCASMTGGRSSPRPPTRRRPRRPRRAAPAPSRCDEPRDRSPAASRRRRQARHRPTRTQPATPSPTACTRDRAVRSQHVPQPAVVRGAHAVGVRVAQRAQPASSATRIVAVARRRSASRGYPPDRGTEQRGIVGEDRALEALSSGGTQPELAVKRPDHVAVDIERLPLTPGPVQGEHRAPRAGARAAARPPRAPRARPPAPHRGPAPDRPGRDPRPPRRADPPGARPPAAQRLERHVGQRRPRHSPSAARNRAAARSWRPAARARLPIFGQALGPAEVEFVRLDSQPVAGRAADEPRRLAAERASQSRDHRQHRLDRPLGGRSPTGPRSPDRARPAPPRQQEHGEQRPLPRARQRRAADLRRVPRPDPGSGNPRSSIPPQSAATAVAGQRVATGAEFAIPEAGARTAT